MTATHQLTLRFFDRRVRVTCDAPDVARAIGLIYERQRLADDGLPPDLEVGVEAGGPAGPRVVVAGRSVRAPAPDRLLHYAHLVLVNAAAAGARNVRVLHAGAVERDGRAVIVLAPSGGGKTTTALALLRRGWRLLSDDFAVVGADGVVHPFPRRLNLTDATLQLLGLCPPAGAVRVATSSRGAKWMVDVDDLVPGAVGQAAPLHAVFVMAPRAETVPAGAAAGPALEAAPGEATWRLELDHIPEGLEERLASVPGVTAVRRLHGAEAPCLEVSVAEGARIVRALDRLLAAMDVAVLAARRPTPALREPARRPALEALALSEALAAVLPHDLGLSGRRFLEGTSDEDVGLAVERLNIALARVAGRLYRLWPGDLAATVELIDGRLAAPEGSGDPA